MESSRHLSEKSFDHLYIETIGPISWVNVLMLFFSLFVHFMVLNTLLIKNHNQAQKSGKNQRETLRLPFKCNYWIVNFQAALSSSDISLTEAAAESISDPTTALHLHPQISGSGWRPLWKRHWASLYVLWIDSAALIKLPSAGPGCTRC